MRGLDGNYINTQGDALARIQVAYQAEQNRQQLRAQLEAADALRKLREDVNEIEKKDASVGPREINNDQGSKAREEFSRENQEKEKTYSELESIESGIEMNQSGVHHVDIRI